MTKDKNKSMPVSGVNQRAKDHGTGYPLDIDSIDHAAPSHGVTYRGNSNEHGHNYGTYPKGKAPKK